MGNIDSMEETNASTLKEETTIDEDLIIKEDEASVFEDLHDSEMDHHLKNIQKICPLCDKRFVSIGSMERHVDIIHKKPYECDVCQRRCLTQRALEKHKVTHQPDRFFTCENCQRKYKSDQNLKRHEIRSHSNCCSKYTCDHCGRKYKQKFDLIVHLKRVHESESQMCRFCGREVKDIKSHEWRHEKRTKETIYEFPCHLCIRKFHSKARLENHVLLHKKIYKCDECGKEYRGPRELSGHKRKHAQPANTCAVCQKVFPSISNFYQHVLTHAGIRPYSCDVCRVKFTQRSSLLRHRKNHPGPLPKLVTSHPQVAVLARSYLNVFETTAPKKKKDNLA